MIALTPDEARVLGVLIEKSFTTPEQYPLSVNAMTAGSNQKNNRDPVLNMSEEQAHDAAEALREKQLAVRVDAVGSRVHKYKHTAGETLRCKSGELAVLGEMLLRGPQTLGELRGRASRMHPLGNLDDVKTMLRGLMEREEPLAKELPPSPGSRAERFAQLLSPDSHPIDASVVPSAAENSNHSTLADRVTMLENEIASLRDAVEKLTAERS